jgi:hypothetical protein
MELPHWELSSKLYKSLAPPNHPLLTLLVVLLILSDQLVYESVFLVSSIILELHDHTLCLVFYTA